MDYRELREVMKFLHCKGLMAKDIYADMLDTLGDSAPSYAMVKKWVTEFKKGRISEDFVRGSGRPRDVSTYENVDFIRNLIKDDERVTVQDIAKYVGISFGSVHTILSKLLELVKVSGRWVPRRVSNERKMTRLEFCKEILAWHRVNPSRLVQQTVVDDAWLYHFERTDILFQPPGQADPENGDEPSESGILNKALMGEKPSVTKKPPDEKKRGHDNGVESTTNDLKDGEKSDLGNSHSKSEPASVIQDDKIGSTESDTVSKSEIKGEVVEPDSTEKRCVKEENSDVNVGSSEVKVKNPEVKLENFDVEIEVNEVKVENPGVKVKKFEVEIEVNEVKVEKSDAKVENVTLKVECSEKNSEVSESKGMDLSVKKSEVSPSKTKHDAQVKLTNGSGASSSVPNMLAILGQKPVNGAQGVPGIIPIMGPHGLTLGQFGAGLTGLNVAQLAALAGMTPLNFAQLAGAGMAQMAHPNFAQMSYGNASTAGQKRPNTDSNPLPKKKQRKERPPSETSCVFWDSEGVIHVETLQPGQKLTGELYCDILKRLKDSMDKKRPGALDSGVLLLEDQAPTGAKPPRGLQLLPVPVNSPDLSPSDFHIFPKVKEYLRCSRLSSRLNAAIEAFIKSQDDSFFKSALSEMERRCTMCVDLNGDYIDK